MSKDPLAQAREALRQAVAVLPALQSDVAAPIAQALERVAEALDRIEADEGRLAAQVALIDDRLLRIENNWIFSAWRRVMGKVGKLRRRAAPTGVALSEYRTWIAHEQAGLPSVSEARAISSKWRRTPSFAVIPLVPKPAQYEFTVSIEAQSYTHHSVPRDHADYLCLVGTPGKLSPLALHYIAESLQSSDVDLLYCDEDHIDATGERSGPIFRPDWSPDLLTSCMYTGSLLVISRRLWNEAGGFRPDLERAELHDLVLRATGLGSSVLHVPRVLFHRVTEPSESPEETQAVIKDAIVSREDAAPDLTSGPVAGSYLVRRQGDTPEITAIICSRSPGLLATCLESLRTTAGEAIRKVIVIAHEEHGPNHDLRQAAQRYGADAVPYTGAFNFAAMNNLGASQAATPHLLFLNDDVRAKSAGWAELLVSHLFTERIGVAGAVLRYPSGEIQHAGIVTGITDGAGHAGRYSNGSEIWPWLLMTRNVSAVTGACLAIRSETFRTLGGFNPGFPNNYNDVDLCFRAREAGLEIVCVPVAGLVHAECQTRPGIVRFEERYRLFRKWGHILSRPDPYYSPSLAPTEQIRLNLAGGGYRALLANRDG